MSVILSQPKRQQAGAVAALFRSAVRPGLTGRRLMAASLLAAVARHLMRRRADIDRGSIAIAAGRAHLRFARLVPRIVRQIGPGWRRRARILDRFFSGDAGLQPRIISVLAVDLAAALHDVGRNLGMLYRRLGAVLHVLAVLPELSAVARGGLAIGGRVVSRHALRKAGIGGNNQHEQRY